MHSPKGWQHFKLGGNGGSNVVEGGDIMTEEDGE